MPGPYDTAADAIPVLTWSRTFPAAPDQVPEARRFLASLLTGSPGAGDALVCLSELVTNSVQHSRSARPGGRFRVRVSRSPGRLTVEVTDEGGRWGPQPPGEDRGRGLVIVGALTDCLHISDPDTDPTARTVTFRLGLA